MEQQWHVLYLVSTSIHVLTFIVLIFQHKILSSINKNILTTQNSLFLDNPLTIYCLGIVFLLNSLSSIYSDLDIILTMMLCNHANLIYTTSFHVCY